MFTWGFGVWKLLSIFSPAVDVWPVLGLDCRAFGRCGAQEGGPSPERTWVCLILPGTLGDQEMPRPWGTFSLSCSLGCGCVCPSGALPVCSPGRPWAQL